MQCLTIPCFKAAERSYVIGSNCNNDSEYPAFVDKINNSVPSCSCQRSTLPIQSDNIKPHPTPLLAVANFLCIKSLYLDAFVFKNFVNFPTKSCLANTWQMCIKEIGSNFRIANTPPLICISTQRFTSPFRTRKTEIRRI